jgi:heme-degrading monooxygenase HmoA
MPNVEIGTDNEVVTAINLFHVDPQNQNELIRLLTTGAEREMSRQPGYVSAAIHRGTDGKHAVVYSQWRSEDDLQAARANPSLRQYFGRLQEIATFELLSYEVSYVHHR